MSLHTSARLSMPAARRSRAELKPSSSPRISGTRSQARMSTLRSLAPAVEFETRARMRCMSPMPLMARMSSAP